MRFKQVGGKADAVTVTVKNAESAAIPAGTPLILSMNGVEDGLAVVLPSTAGAAKSNAVLYGVAVAAIAPNALADAITFGFISNAKLLLATRDATSDSWSASASIDTWGVLAVDTVNDAFSLQSASQAPGDFMPFAVLAQSVAAIVASTSYAASTGASAASDTVSSLSDTRTAITASVRAFVRLL